MEQVGEIAEAIDAIDRYSYQYNVKIVGIPEVNFPETALDTSTLCVKLFKEMGVEISLQDIDIAHRVPTRSASSGSPPIICKFTRRLVKKTKYIIQFAVTLVGLYVVNSYLV